MARRIAPGSVRTASQLSAVGERASASSDAAPGDSHGSRLTASATAPGRTGSSFFRGHEDKETRRQRDKEKGLLPSSPCLAVSLSPCLTYAVVETGSISSRPHMRSI